MSDLQIDPVLLDLVRWEMDPGDGVPIRGDLRFPVGTEPRSAVVICHGFKGFRSWGFFPPLAGALARRGHAVVTFDFSRNGVGADGVDFSALELFAENTHSRNLEEIRMVLDALAEGRLFHYAPERIGLFGHSRGGGEAILAAAEDRRVQALVTWAAISTVERWPDDAVEQWQRGETVQIPNARTGQEMPIRPLFWRDLERNRDRLDIAGAAERVDVPWLIVHGEDDTSVSPDDARALFAVAGEKAELLLIEGGDHTFGARHPFTSASPELSVASQSTAGWFDAFLRSDEAP